MKKRFLSLLLALITALCMIPVTGIVSQAEYVNVGRYITNIGVASKKTTITTNGESEAKKILKNNGYTCIDKDLNRKAGGAYVYLGFKCTGDYKNAITGILVRVGKNPPESITYKNSAFYLPGGNKEANVADEGKVDLNEGAGGEYLYLYVTRDTSYGPPLVDLDAFISVDYDGYHTVTDTNGNAKCVNEKGKESAFGYYIEYKNFTDYDFSKLSLHIRYANENGELVSTEQTTRLKRPDEVFKPNISIPSQLNLSEMSAKLVGWNTKNDSNSFDINYKELSVSRTSASNAEQNILMQAIYDAEIKLTYDANGGNLTPPAQTVSFKLKAGNSGRFVMSALNKFKITDQKPVKSGSCTFLGWDTDKNATTASYTSGQEVNFTKNTTLYAIYKSHEYEYSASGNVITETCKNGCGHKETATLKLKNGADLSYTGSAIEPLEVVYSSGWKGGALNIAYYNNISADTNSGGLISIKGVTARQAFTIKNGKMTNITAADVSVIYDGDEHSITVNNIPKGATVTYGRDGKNYSVGNYSFTEVGEYTVYYKVEKDNYDTVTGAATVTISKAENKWITEPSIAGWTYGDNAKAPNKGTPKFGSEVKVEYKPAAASDGKYTTIVPTNAGSYTARFTVNGTENYTELSKTVNFEIAKAKLTVKANDKTVTYGEGPKSGGVTYSGFVLNENANDLDGTLTLDFGYTQYGNAGTYDITPKGLTSNNYEIEFKKGTLTVKQKEIAVNWSNTEFTYDGKAHKPTATTKDFIPTDNAALYVSGEQVNANKDGETYTAAVEITGMKSANYKLAAGTSATTTFTIKRADQVAPSGLAAVNETVDGKSDGKITGVTSAMEYRKENETAYTATGGTEITMLDDGVYYIRYKADPNRNASAASAVTVAKGAKLKVTVPEKQTGYTLNVDKTELLWHGNVTLTFNLKDGYSKLSDFAVKVNGESAVLDNNGKYTVTDAERDIEITVSGVADITAPTAEIVLGENKWSKLFNTISFGLFFKNTQTVTVTAADNGSGLDRIYYYLSTAELDEKALADAEWKEYIGAFKLNPQDEYIIYVKATDKDGNTAYISSEKGIVIDDIAPVISGIANGEALYGNTDFEVTDKHLYEVTVDGKAVTSANGKYTIVADGKEHTVVATDKSDNASEEITVTVITIASLDDSIEDITVDNVKSSDKQAIEDVQKLVSTLIDGDKTFTESEEAELDGIKENTKTLLDKISEISDMMSSLTESVNGYDEKTVKEEDKTALAEITAKIDNLLNGDNLTDTEKDEMSALKEKVEGLIKRIEDAASSGNTDSTDKVKDITSDNVKPEDKSDLEKAKDELEKALDDYKDNLTDEDKQDIKDKLDRIDNALEVIDRIEKLEALINGLPDTAAKEASDAIKAAKDAYNALSSYEQSLLSNELKEKLSNAESALEKLNNNAGSSQYPATGDNSKPLPILALAILSGIGILGTAACKRKKRKS